jgi:ABC-2 type transport system permease protein
VPIVEVCDLAMNAMLTFVRYPSDIFQGAVRFMMFTILPAAFVGLVPLNVVRGLNLNGLAILVAAAVTIAIISCVTFYAGLRRYESGSAINANV